MVIGRGMKQPEVFVKIPEENQTYLDGTDILRLDRNSHTGWPIVQMLFQDVPEEKENLCGIDALIDWDMPGQYSHANKFVWNMIERDRKRVAFKSPYLYVDLSFLVADENQKIAQVFQVDAFNAKLRGKTSVEQQLPLQKALDLLAQYAEEIAKERENDVQANLIDGISDFIATRMIDTGFAVEAEKILLEFIAKAKTLLDTPAVKTALEKPEALTALQRAKLDTIQALQLAQEKLAKKIAGLPLQATQQAEISADELAVMMSKLREDVSHYLNEEIDLIQSECEHAEAHYLSQSDLINKTIQKLQATQQLKVAPVTDADPMVTDSSKLTPSVSTATISSMDVDNHKDEAARLKDAPCGDAAHADLQSSVNKLVTIALNVQQATDSSKKRDELQGIITALLQKQAVITQPMLQNAFKNMLLVVLPHRKLSFFHVPLFSTTDSGDCLLAELRNQNDLVKALKVNISDEQEGLSYQDLRVHATNDKQVTNLFFRRHAQVPTVKQPFKYDPTLVQRRSL